MMRSHATRSFALLTVFLLAGCASTTTQVAEEVPAPAPIDVNSKPAAEPVSIEEVIRENTSSEAVAVAPQTAEVAPKLEAGGLEIVFFDYDSSDLTADARQILNHHAEWLHRNQEVTATIEGHCDERGSDQYNLALGEQRATATRDYLLAQGVTADRLAVISYGEAQPAAHGHEEIAWEMNRRVAFR